MFLGVTEKAIRARVSRQLIPFKKFAGRIVFRRAELEQFIDGLPSVTVAQAQANVAAAVSLEEGEHSALRGLCTKKHRRDRHE